MIADAGALSSRVRLDETPIAESEEVRPGVVLDHDDRQQVVGIEILGVNGRIARASLREAHVRIA